VAEEKAAEARAARDASRVAALARKTALAEEAEQIAAESTQWKTAGDRLREILDEWKTIKGIEKKADSELWKRYSAARDAFTRRRGTHFAGLDAQRKQASGRKEDLVVEAETLSESTEWSAAANRLKELMSEWKAAPRAAKDVEQKLWERFRAAQDRFFARRSEVFSARDAEHKAAVDRRQALVVEAEALDVDADPRAAQARLREIQGQWHDAGRVPRESAAGLDRRMRAVEERVRAAMDSAWRRTTPESNPLLSQMRDQVAEAEQRLARAQAAGDAKRVREAEDALQSKRRFLELAEHSG
jgi:chromosome segregation ATPase